jgi:hypothetical protein
MKQQLELRDGMWICPGCAAQLEDGVLDHREGCPQIALIVAAYGQVGGPVPGDGEPPLPELLGMAVRAVRVAWALQQPHPEPSWLFGWDQLSEADRDADRRIGLALYVIGADDAGGRWKDLVHRLIAEYRACTCPDPACRAGWPHPVLLEAAEASGFQVPGGEQL